MKIYKNHFLKLMSVVILVTTLMISCENEEVESVPSVTGIELSRQDTTVLLQERYVYIKGAGLDDVQKVYFNNIETLVNPAYVTPSVITVLIPKDFPENITNKVSLVTASGLVYDFDCKVAVRNPIINEANYLLLLDKIVYTGANFAHIHEVSIDGIIIEEYDVSDDLKTITFTPPSGISSGVILAKAVCEAGTGELEFDFEEAAKPVIENVPCEWVDAGKIMAVEGKNLAYITSLTMGNVDITDGFIYNKDASVLKFTVPEGVAEGGKIAYKVNNALGFESVPFEAKYKTAEILIWDFEGLDNGLPLFPDWGSSVTASHFTDVDGISGAYWIVQGDIADSWWDQENMCMNNAEAFNPPTTDMLSHPENYVLKFEMNVKNPWSVGVLAIYFGWNIEYKWDPHADGAFQTDGWQTVSIPLSDIPFNGATGLADDYMLKFFTGGLGTSENTYVAIDNYRIDKAK